MKRFALIAVVLLAANACSECTGTLDCRVEPQINYSGQIVDRDTRRGVSGLAIAFVRDSGVHTNDDTVKAVSDGEGFFTLRGTAAREGMIHGHLYVSGPTPFSPYTVPVVTFTASTTRGDGGFIGRLVSRPFFRLVGFVRDRKTGVALEGVRVFWRRNGGGRVAQDTVTFVTGIGGAFSWLPQVTAPGAIDATFEITATGYPRTFVLRRTLDLQYFENDMSIQYLPVGMGFPQFAVTGRRGTGAPLPGTTIRLTRLAGVQIQPQQVTVTPTEFGAFGFPLEPQSPGTTFVEVRINPPAPFPPESRTIPLVVSDDDIVRNIGFMGVGTHVYFGAELRDSLGALIPEDTPVRIRRVAGLSLLLTPTFPDGDHRPVNSRGRFEYGTPTADTGSVTFDFTVQHAAPFIWDTIRGVTIPSRYNDTLVNLGTITLPRRRKP